MGSGDWSCRAYATARLPPRDRPYAQACSNAASPMRERSAASSSPSCGARGTYACSQPLPLASRIDSAAASSRTAGWGLAINQATDTVLASNNSAGTTASLASVSVINGATCNATTTTGCGQHPPVALTGANASAAAVDPGTDTAYVPAFGDNTV